MITVVTGASGHVGNNLVRSLLAEGRQVRVMTHHNTSALDTLNVEQIHGDILDPNTLNAAFEGADVVYHLAARVSIETSGWAELHSINTIGTRNVANACLKNRVRRLVHFSSIDAIEQKPVDIPVNESSPLATGKRHPPYDRSKAEAEIEIMSALNKGLDAVIINPTSVIGPFDYHPSHQGQMLLLMARQKLPALVNGGFNWVDVRDVVQGAITAEKQAQRGSKYILGGHWASLAEIAQMVKQQTGAKIPGFTCPLWLAEVTAPLTVAYEHARGHRPLYTRAAITAINSNKFISHHKAETELNYHPRPLEQTISDTLAWFADCGKLRQKPV
jgi:dihydroflavonol-4-reductase